MFRTSLIAALLCGATFTYSGQALAQDTTVAQADPTDPDASDDTANAAIAGAAPVDDAAAKIELLQAQVEALQQAIEGLKTQVTKVTPTWKGAPQFDDKDAGFSFKPKGLIQLDAGYVGYPDGNELRGTVGGLNYANLGWNGRARRAIIGAEGTIPGGFRYNAEFNLAQGAVDYEDIFLAYDFKKAPVTIQIGNFYPFSSLETMTSSRFTSFLERASFTDAFNYNRRLGLGVIFSDKKTDSYIVQAGIFNAPINDASFTRTSWQASLRGVYSPTLGSTRLHIGANVQHRLNPEEGRAAQYRTRPLTQITDQRFIDTGNLAARGDDAFGLEFGGIMKSFHFAAEAQKVWVRHAYDASEILDLNTETGSNDAVPAGAIPLNGNPSFKGGYVELGYFLTGETRGYKGGRWDRTKVLKPFSDGGWGAIQVNGRLDYVELRDRVDGFSTFAAPFYLNGGKQLGAQLSLIWNPVDYVRFMAQYGHVAVTGGPRAATVEADSSNTVNKRKFGVDTVAVRAQLDF
ncbi:MAG: OprO/OprP family phosphate-selective porin [Sphingomicrobium sp.]